MADLLHELLVGPATSSSKDRGKGQDKQPGASPDPVALAYLSGLASSTLSSLETTEVQSLTQSSHTLLLSLQGLAKRSHKTIIDSGSHHSNLRTALPALASCTDDLRTAIPRLDSEAVRFSTTYHKSGDNEMLEARKRALLLSRNVERLVDVLDLPTLLSSAISSSSTTTTTTTAGPSSSSATAAAASSTNYASALDLNAHIRRLHALYPDSQLVASVTAQADDAMQGMATNLIASLRAPGLKLASALRTIGWLRRVIPDLDEARTPALAGNGGGLGALFLVCRLATLMNMLEALEPLRELADQEKVRQQQQQQQQQQQKQHNRSSSQGNSNSVWSSGQQTEKYLKRYIEIFREQSFAIISMFRSIFPPAAAPASAAFAGDDKDNGSLLEPRKGHAGPDPLLPVPSALSTFPLHLVEMLMGTLRRYLPTVRDQASRDSLLTQVLYCAGSLGRLGGDFTLALAGIDVGTEAGPEDEWVEVLKRHRLMAGRLESIVGASGNKAVPR